VRHLQTIDVGGDDWAVGAVPVRSARAVDTRDDDAVREWIPATVPGNVRADLLAAGHIPDPFVVLDNEQSRWVDDHDWWYRKTFTQTLSEDERAFLVFDGIDYLAAVYLDGMLLGCYEGMFSRQIYEVTHLMQSPSEDHLLAVRLVGPAHFPKRELSSLERIWEAFSARLPGKSTAFPERLNFLKCQMGFGWDFAPQMRTIGIWDDVGLIVVRSVLIRDARIRTTLEGDQARIALQVELDSDQERDIKFQVEVRERGSTQPVASHTFDATLSPGEQHISTSFTLDHPKLWQPWDRGTPHLYDLTLQLVRRGNGAHPVLDSFNQSFGIREIALKRPPGASLSAEPWLFWINGQAEFVRGANWVPMDSMPGRLRRADYEGILDQVCAAGINMLRVWGGGLREKAAFYDLCDEKGLLVWQDFPFACAFLGYYPRNSRFLNLVRQECAGIVRQLRTHPSIVLWCGGNEFSPMRNRQLVDVLRSIVTEEDGTRPFKRVSPDRGEVHNWRVWHGKASISHYRRERAIVLAEFGLQAPPALDSLRKFLSQGGIWPPGGEWTYHNAEFDKLFRYARPLLASGIESLEDLLSHEDPKLLETFIAASQHAQAHGLQVAIEHIRRRKGRTGGVLLWQLNEPWPAICWSIIDYYRQPKPAYHKVCQVYNPVLLSVLYPLKRYQPGDTLEIELWGINDLLDPVEGLAEVILDRETIQRQEVFLPPDSSQPVARIAHALDHIPQVLSTRLTARSGDVISTNDYDLTYVQSPEPSWKDYLISRLAELTVKW
jgi:beta-mannosidase